MRVFIVAILLIVSFLEAKVYKVGFAQDTLANDWRKAQADAVESEASKYDFIDLSIKDAKGSVATQILHIEEFIESGFDFIITSPIDSKITSQVLKKALDRGIKVVLISRGVDSDNYTTFVRPNDAKIAKEAAEYLAKEMGYKGVVLMLQGVRGATTSSLRESGFEEVIREYPDMSIVKKRANYLRNDAMVAMKEIFDSKTHFDAIYSHSDSMLIGARIIIDEYKKEYDFLSVGIDYIKDAKKAILEGKQNASFTYPTVGKEGVLAVVKLIEGEEVEKDVIIDTTMITKENAKDVEPIF